MVAEIALITQALGAASSAVALFDRISDQVERFVTRRTEPDMPPEHRMQLAQEDGEIVARIHGQVVQTIGADDLARLPASQLRHVQTLEASMESYYAQWAAVYPQLASAPPLEKAKLDQQLEGVIRAMRIDLERIFAFLESCGLRLDDHYMHVRALVQQV